MLVRYYGQSCVEIEAGGAKLLFDPFITPNELASEVDINTLNPDYILVTHGHQDHVADLEDLANRSGARIITNFEIVEWLGSKGVENVYPMNHGGAANFPFGRVKYVNAIHSSKLPDGSDGGNPGGFVVDAPDGTFYHAGDTALTYDMKLIAEEFALDFALLPIGDNFTMGIEDAAKAADFINCSKIVGIHYDTFPYIEIDKEYAQRYFQEKGKALHLINIGEAHDL
jgi:L-ascorbate metabolism protein UlaG (beta-lactamase superfamily)